MSDPKQGASRKVGRFFVGRALNGDRKTDATFLHDGRKTLVPIRVYRWSWLAGWKRALIRVFVAAFTVLGAWTALFGSFLPDLLRSAGWVTLPIWIVGGWLLLKQRQHRKTYRLPTAQVYADTFNVPVHVAVGQIEVPMNHIEDDESVTVIRLPETHVKSAAQDTALGMRFAKKLGIPDATVEIDHVGVPTLKLRCAPPPPKSVTHDDMLEHLKAGTATTTFLGLGRRNRPVWTDWLVRPWMGMTFPTRHGKSTLCALIAAQFLRWGALIVVIDCGKAGESHSDWCLDENGDPLPGVEFHDTVEGAHDALIRWNQERLRRSKAKTRRSLEVFQRVFVIIEESPITIIMLRDYWSSIRAQVAKDTGEPQPLRCPSIAALTGLVCAGASTGINGVLIAQKLSSAASGGEIVRENLDPIVLGRASNRTFDNLFPGRRPRPRMSAHPGCVTLGYASGEMVEFQVGYLTAEQARDWATSGQSQPVVTAIPVSPESASSSASSFDANRPSSDTDDTTPSQSLTVAGGPSPGRLVSLSEAILSGIVHGTKDRIKTWDRRHPGDLPKPRSKRGQTFMYDPGELAAWDKTRDLSDLSDLSELDEPEEMGDAE